ncbi:MAG: hypothetical protein UT13_C0001G0350 [Candidatus Pacebacteria bacterium GW2011_GWF2_38_9]|nr:MAG: hypothetical protein US01_C0001G0358 [candidate division TM6 bacterium GW2011_GWF2_28_16]KKQ10339.1 MAG: hypothetical protein US20_C0001G0053 [Candidatus Pacebacteria bacterium GW2011_GWF1_36_5]KKQ88703.1 MAG: hypothetical protein UT13_C0001G0350 [Candidatus Pacebacteria bacterium GW2011_GWF2_38_9]HAZ73652.1 hypothetical protein [Candidatus Paceibacterota bacterium]
MKENQKKSKKKWLKWLLLFLLAVIVFGVFQFFKFQKDSEVRRESSMAQQEKMMEFWKSEGLSDEEIDQKLKEQRSEFVRNDNPSIVQSMMRTVRHTTGTGPGTGMR